MFEEFCLLTVALIWGFTNPLMKYGIDSNSSSSTPRRILLDYQIQTTNSRIRRFMLEIQALLLNWKYLLAYGINQLGSLLFYYTLGQADLSIASPLTNSLTFVFTFLFGHFVFGEKSELNGVGWLGLCCVICGVVIIFFDKLS